MQKKEIIVSIFKLYFFVIFSRFTEILNDHRSAL